MDTNSLLSRVTVSTPCTMDWNSMDGDNSVRFCSRCQKHVYNLTSMTSDEATALICAMEGRLCGRLFRRADGTIVTSDCKRALAQVAKPFQFTLRSILWLITTAAAALGIGRAYHQARIAADQNTLTYTLGVIAVPINPPQSQEASIPPVDQ
jgi:hypothetical protein